MKKICFFMATPFTKGGEQRVVSVLAGLLYERGYDVSILCTDFTPINYDLYNLNPNVHIRFVDGFNDSSFFKYHKKREELYIENLTTGKYKNSLYMQKKMNCDNKTAKLIAKIINKEKYDCIISLSTIYNTMLAVIKNRIKAKAIGWQHSVFEAYFEAEGRRHYNQDKFSRYMFKKLDKYVVLTDYDQKKIKEKFNYNTVVINNPKTLSTNITSDLSKKSFLALGRFVEVKNFKMLIDMFYEFHKKNKEWKLDIYGEGPLKEELEKKIRDYKLDNYITIHQYENDISKCYLNSSIYLMSSLYEGWSMVVTEAMEYGLPIISFDIPCIKERVEDEKNGYLIEKYNQEKFVEKMLLLANNSNLIKKIGKENRKKSENNSNSNIVDKWVEIIEN